MSDALVALDAWLDGWAPPLMAALVVLFLYAVAELLTTWFAGGRKR